MQNDLFNVVLIFNPRDPEACANILNLLKKLKRLPPKQSDAILKNGRLVLKRNAPRETARTLASQMKIQGVECRLEVQPHQGPTVSQTHTQKQGPTSLPSDEMICPKCQLTQPLHTECRRCGIVISKFRQKSVVKAESVKYQEPPVAKALDDIQNAVDSEPSQLKKYLGAIPRWHSAVLKWSQKPLNAVSGCCVLTLTALILLTFLLYVAQYLWFIYTATTVGQTYQETQPEISAVIGHLMEMNAVTLSWQVVSMVLVINLLVSLSARLIHLSHTYLDSGGFGIKLMWILPSAGVSAFLLHQKDPLLHYAFAFILSLIPTVLLIRACLNLASVCFPNIGGAVKRIFTAIRHRGPVLEVIKKIPWFDNQSGGRKE
jgi:ribosomal protein L40E